MSDTCTCARAVFLCARGASLENTQKTRDTHSWALSADRDTASKTLCLAVVRTAAAAAAHCGASRYVFVLVDELVQVVIHGSSAAGTTSICEYLCVCM